MCKVRIVEQGFESCTEPEFFQAYYLQLQKLQLLQSCQFKHTPLDSFAESIINFEQMNLIVVAATSVKFKTAFLNAWWAMNFGL